MGIFDNSDDLKADSDIAVNLFEGKDYREMLNIAKAFAHAGEGAPQQTFLPVN